MNRRDALGLMAGLPLLAGCGATERATPRFRVIAMVDVDGRRVEGSTVMEVAYSRRKTKSAIGTGGAATLRGETLILDLPGRRGTIFMLPYEHQDRTSLTQVFEPGIKSSLGIQRGVGSMSDDDYARLRAAKGRIPFFIGAPNRPTRLPAFVAFRNEADPATIYEVDPRRMEQFFPGVRFAGLDLEFADAPLTHALADRLKWVRSKGEGFFPRDPPGPQQRPARDKPIGYKITTSHFFGSGSR